MSLRARLLAGMAVVSFVLVAAAVIIARTTESYLVDRVDDQLALVPTRFGAVDQFPGRPTDGQFQTPSSFFAAEIVDGTLTVRLRPSVVASGSGTPRISISQATSAARSGKFFTVDTKNGSDRYRIRADRDADGNVVLVGLSLRDVDASVHRLELLLVAAVVMVVAILGLVIFWVLRLGVRPIKRMTKTATEIAGGDLSQRVPAGRPGTEASDLGDALNAMMTRIEDAFDQRAASEARLRRFVADASHELRTPVTTIRGYAELYRHGGLGETDELNQAMRRTEQESIRMASLIDDLLLLARLDEGRPLTLAPVDLGVLAVDAAADARAVAPERDVHADVSAGVIVEGDEDRLRQVLGNLVANALVHTPVGTPVAVRVHDVDGQAVVEVHDDGPGMPPDVVARAFERFSRADASRSRNAGGSGLGLAIVQAIVVAHHGAVTIDSGPDAGTTVRVELPRLPAGESPRSGLDSVPAWPGNEIRSSTT